MKNNILKFDNCFGCGVCVGICPLKLIKLRLTDEGFWAPTIDNQENCTECGLCLRTCAFSDSKISQSIPRIDIKSYAAYSNNSNIVSQCSSGGLAFEIGRTYLEYGYKIIGCRYNLQHNQAEHFIADTLQQLLATRGSKYIPSNLAYIISEISRDEKYVIFASPCQIDSLRRFLQLKNLEKQCILVDFFCHGVPSLLAWQEYLNFQKKKYNVDNFQSIRFRDKKYGWHAWTIGMTTQEREIFSSTLNGDLFYKLFLGDYCLNLPCYRDCKYKQIQSAADLRIGDLWSAKFKNNNQGVSGLVVLTEQGNAAILGIKSSCIFQEEPLSIVTEGQMKICPKIPEIRTKILKLLKKKQFHKIKNYFIIIGWKLLPLRIFKKIIRELYKLIRIY